MRRIRSREPAELEITSFMNLMIILVPVLLLNMVFANITVIDLALPAAGKAQASETPIENQTLELVVLPQEVRINFPAGKTVKTIPATPNSSAAYAYKDLGEALKDIKRSFQNRDIKKRDILILSQPDTPYQTIVQLMDTVRSYKTVIAGSEVDAELFPSISLGDAPVFAGANDKGGNS